MMASSISSPRASRALWASFRRTKADSSWGRKVFPPSKNSFWVPIHVLKEAAVSPGWVISRSFATAPTVTVPSSSTPTQLGVRSCPHSLGSSSARPFRYMLTSELVVPKSIPMIATVPQPPFRQ